MVRWRTRAGGERREANSKVVCVYLLVRLAAAAAELSLMALSHRWPKSFCSTITRPSPAITRLKSQKQRGQCTSEPGCTVYVCWFHPCWRTSQTPREEHPRPGSIKAARPHPQRTPHARFTRFVYTRQQLWYQNSLASQQKLQPRSADLPSKIMLSGIMYSVALFV